MESNKMSSIFVMASTHAPYVDGLVPYISAGAHSADNSSINLTANGSYENGPGPPPESRHLALWQSIIVIIICSIITLATILGNMLVCLAVAIVKKLRTPSNLLIVSLAVSDCLVGLLVMPFAGMYEVTGSWLLGKTACDAWTSSDVLLCTASILNLCAISIDRYLVITRPFKYAVKRTPKRMAFTIACVWLLSALVSIPPLLGWKSKSEDGVCQYSDSKSYQIYATVCAFYIPLIVMIVVYVRIYMVSHKIARDEAKSKPSREGYGGGSSGLTTPLRRDSNELTNHIYVPNGRSNPYKNSDASKNSSDIVMKGAGPNKPCCGLFSRVCRPKFGGKESKATKTLGVIMGAFTACWLPFFILALIKPFLPDDVLIPHWLNSLFLWLGFANSCLNPVIYARFNREFRQPFKEIILCRCRTINKRIRLNTYAEQYGNVQAQRYSLKPPQASVVKYDSHGQTIVGLGNGTSVNNNGAKL